MEISLDWLPKCDYCYITQDFKKVLEKHGGIITREVELEGGLRNPKITINRERRNQRKREKRGIETQRRNFHFLIFLKNFATM
jgi:hypothetical protein